MSDPIFTPLVVNVVPADPPTTWAPSIKIVPPPVTLMDPPLVTAMVPVVFTVPRNKLAPLTSSAYWDEMSLLIATDLFLNADVRDRFCDKETSPRIVTLLRNMLAPLTSKKKFEEGSLFTVTYFEPDPNLMFPPIFNVVFTVSVEFPIFIVLFAGTNVPMFNVVVALVAYKFAVPDVVIVPVARLVVALIVVAVIPAAVVAPVTRNVPVTSKLNEGVSVFTPT